MGGQATHQDKYVHPEVATSILIQPFWQPPPPPQRSRPLIQHLTKKLSGDRTNLYENEKRGAFFGAQTVGSQTPPQPPLPSLQQRNTEKESGTTQVVSEGQAQQVWKRPCETSPKYVCGLYCRPLRAKEGAVQCSNGHWMRLRCVNSVPSFWQAYCNLKLKCFLLYFWVPPPPPHSTPPVPSRILREGAINRREETSARKFFARQNSVFQMGAEFPPHFFSVGAEYSPCRQTPSSTKQTRMVKFNSLRILPSEELLLAAWLYCMSFGEHNPRIPFLPMHSRLGGAEFSTAENSPCRTSPPLWPAVDS